MTETQLKILLIVISIFGIGASCGYLFLYSNPPLPYELTVHKGALRSFSVDCGVKNSHATLEVDEHSTLEDFRVPCNLDWSALQYGKDVEIKTYSTYLATYFYPDIEIWHIETAGKLLLDESQAMSARKEQLNFEKIYAIGFLGMFFYQVFGERIKRLFETKKSDRLS